ncbi:hypothetical protein [Actibacterium lipolyticum]|uniref:Uncharacterized protein n=1 Tax=Actibacterium lipolyticum TaxID=1524263 RepID=A0A238JLV8_9RHOB|nr:hypothetical protein [Actibacterium lipolyticum]SMX31631.1 hypothetical protein COL8621_00547 [Actibacterium lipolyticum]
MVKQSARHELCVPTELLEALNRPEAPSEIWQAPFDHIRGHCERIAETTEPTDLLDFCDFFLDYQYMPVQEDLLAFAFPKALEAWARQELGTPAPERFKGDWHFEGMWHALAYRPIHPEFFDAAQFNAVTEFFVRVLLARMQQEKRLSFQGSGASPHEWIYLHATLIWQFPVAEQIWKRWWSFDTPELAVSAVQWLSAFIYDMDDNPYFKPWTRREGGGPPTVFETHHMRVKAAPPENADFISSILTKERVEEVLLRAVELLSKHERADQVYETWLDLSRRSETFEERAKKFTTLMRRDKQEMVISWDDI